jgi:hypothetical protein
MSKRVYFDGAPRVEYSACTPELKLPSFALWNHGRTLTPEGAMLEAIARRNRKRIATRCTHEGECRALLTDRKQALPGSDMFHVPRATIYFKVRLSP